MKIAHSLVITPGLCGLYQSAKEIIQAERKLGHDAFIVEPEGSSMTMTDPDMQVEKSVEGADVIIDHSGCDGAMLRSGIPIIHLRHGRPLSTFLIEHKGGQKIYSNLRTIGQDKRYVAVATMWHEHMHHLAWLMNRSVDFIPAPVDLDRFSQHGAYHDFGGKKGIYNIVVADMWRDDEVPLDAIMRATWEAVERGGKVHVYGIRNPSTAQKTLLSVAGEHLGEVGWAKDMAPIYRSADKVYTSASIATRVVREALACGCPVEMKDGTEIFGARAYAEQHFNPLASAVCLVKLAERHMQPV